MKKTMLAVLLSAFLCNSVFADEKTGYVEEYSEILAQESNSENELLEHESIDSETIDAEYVEPEYVEAEYIEESYEEAIDTGIEEALELSTQDNLLSILESCKEYTLEDGVEEKDLNSYLLICINNILNENGYKSVKSVPVE
tara:strand:- start:10501 stop:10926 length:426 start_codon:yes stop_codon:yes gene_type:complete